MVFKLALHLPRIRVACKPSPSAQQVPTVRSCRRPVSSPACWKWKWCSSMHGDRVVQDGLLLQLSAQRKLDHSVWLHTDPVSGLWCPAAHPAWTRLILAVSSATAWASALPSLVGFHPSSMGHITDNSVWLAVRRDPQP